MAAFGRLAGDNDRIRALRGLVLGLRGVHGDAEATAQALTVFDEQLRAPGSVDAELGAGALKARAGRLCCMETESSKPLRFAARRIKGGELLIIATTAEPGAALNAYKKRWAIECLFGDAKTRGLNLEDTRLVIPAKLDTLLALMALAVAWAGKTASVLVGRGEISRKTHGYRAKSWFRTGFDQLRSLVTACLRLLED